MLLFIMKSKNKNSFVEFWSKLITNVVPRTAADVVCRGVWALSCSFCSSSMCRGGSIHTANHGVTEFILGTFTEGVTSRTVRIVWAVLRAVASISTTLACWNKCVVVSKSHTVVDIFFYNIWNWFIVCKFHYDFLIIYLRSHFCIPILKLAKQERGL